MYFATFQFVCSPSLRGQVGDYFNFTLGYFLSLNEFYYRMVIIPPLHVNVNGSVDACGYVFVIKLPSSNIMKLIV